MRRVSESEVKTLADYLPGVNPGCLLLGNGPDPLQGLWDGAVTGQPQRLRWIY